MAWIRTQDGGGIYDVVAAELEINAVGNDTGRIHVYQHGATGMGDEIQAFAGTAEMARRAFSEFAFESSGRKRPRWGRQHGEMTC